MAAIFIDGSNLYYNTAKKGIRINFQKLINELTGERKLINAFYYVAPLDIAEDADKYWKHQKFLDIFLDQQFPPPAGDPAACPVHKAF